MVNSKLALNTLTVLSSCALFISGNIARAQEATVYKYDPLGRLTAVQKVGGPNNGACTTYRYDSADNRTNVTTNLSWQPICANGTEDGGGSGTPPVESFGFIVAPLLGGTLIFIK